MEAMAVVLRKDDVALELRVRLAMLRLGRKDVRVKVVDGKINQGKSNNP
jgi:hypothetical protein